MRDVARFCQAFDLARERAGENGCRFDGGLPAGHHQGNRSALPGPAVYPNRTPQQIEPLADAEKPETSRRRSRLVGNKAPSLVLDLKLQAVRNLRRAG